MSDLVTKLSIATGMDQVSVRRIMMTAPHRYKSYHIAKRNGSLRRISQPAREVKALQRAFIELILTDLPIHAGATAYRRGLSIRDNAAAHCKSGPVLKMDFKDFFPSIKRSDWASYCARTGCLNDTMDIELSGSLLFQYQPERASQRLAIGAPSSPMLSNILMFDFDQGIESRLAGGPVVYTRYADDLTFSAPRTGYMHDIYKFVKQTIKSIPYPTLKINDDKTTYVTNKYHRCITGLTLTLDGRVTIGSQKKRELSAKVHHARYGRLDNKSMQALAGYLSFVNSVEPEFLRVLSNKYGSELIRKILSSSTIHSKI